jgi:RNA polymerase primary sigma factor
VESEELFQVCFIALGDAVRAFDAKKGYRFSSLAWTYMNTAVKHNFKNLTGYTWNEYWNKIKIKIMLETTSNLVGYRVSLRDLLEMGLLNMSYYQAEEKYNLPDTILDSYAYDAFKDDEQITTFEEYEEYDDYEDKKYENMIDGENEDIVSEQAISGLLKEDLLRVLGDLTEKERLVIKLRYGLNINDYFTPTEISYIEQEKGIIFDGRPLTLGEVGRIFGVTSERIRQIEAKAIRRLRNPSRSYIIRDYLDDKVNYHK